MELTTSEHVSVQKRRKVAGCEIELCHFQWDKLSEATFTPDQTYLEYTNIRAEGRCLSYADTGLVRQGPIRYYPSGYEYYSRWSDKAQESIICVLDLQHLVGCNVQVQTRRIAETLNIRNDFLLTAMRRLKQEVERPSLPGDIFLQSLSTTIAMEIVRHFSYPLGPEKPYRAVLRDGYVERLRARLRDERFQVDIEQLAQEEGLSSRHFSRLFHACHGRTVGQFVQECFAQVARDLLDNPKLLIKQVAYQCGFSETSAFTRAFARAVGVTPTQYRNNV
jgi:AraC family transcriptional regulator